MPTKAKIKSITLDEIIKAAEKNGYPWNGNGAGEMEPGEIRYCVLQQVSLNLFGDPRWIPISDALDDFTRGNLIGREVWHYNDDKATSYKDVVNYLKERLSQFPPETTIEVTI